MIHPIVLFVLNSSIVVVCLSIVVFVPIYSISSIVKRYLEIIMIRDESRYRRELVSRTENEVISRAFERPSMRIRDPEWHSRISKMLDKKDEQFLNKKGDSCARKDR